MVLAALPTGLGQHLAHCVLKNYSLSERLNVEARTLFPCLPPPCSRSLSAPPCCLLSLPHYLWTPLEQGSCNENEMGGNLCRPSPSTPHPHHNVPEGIGYYYPCLQPQGRGLDGDDVYWEVGIESLEYEGAEGLALGKLNIPSNPLPHPGEDRGWTAFLSTSGPFLPSFLQREGWLFQVQARTVVRNSRETSGSMMASTSIVPARAADRRGMRTRKGRGEGS